GLTAGEDDRNKKKWLRMTRGNLVLFYGGNRVFASGLVRHKLHSPRLARQLWGVDENGLTWEYTYFVDSWRSRNIPYSELNDELGYDPGYVVRGFVIVNATRGAEFVHRLQEGQTV